LITAGHKVSDHQIKWSLASYPGSRWAGKERAWYPLFAHALNLPEILGNCKLSCYIRHNIMYTYCYIVRKFSDQRWKRFDRSFFWALQLLPVARYFWYESQESTGSY